MLADTLRAPAAAHVLQVTDCHLFPDPETTLLGVNTHASLAAVLRAACREQTPDAILATGDIAQDPSPGTYRLFLDTVRAHFDGPLLCVPGNHDHGATFAAALPVDDLAVGNWRVAGVDTHLDDVVGGSVGSRELARLANTLAGLGEMPTLVVGHHCPVDIGCPWLDVHRIEDGEALLGVLDRAGVEVYAFGHIHQEATVDSRILGTPSTCFQFRAASSEFAIDDAKPGYRWLHLAEDGSFTTEVRRTADFPMTINLTDRGRR